MASGSRFSKGLGRRLGMVEATRLLAVRFWFSVFLRHSRIPRFPALCLHRRPQDHRPTESYTTCPPDHVTDGAIQAYYAGNHTANGPLRGTKADIWEAGHRVPFFARWPGRIPAGSRCGRTICHVDFFATAAAVAGLKLPVPQEAAPDSFSWLPLFEGKTAAFKRAPVVHHSGGGTFAIRNGPWKLILGNGSGGREKPRGQRFGVPWQLYNLTDDLRETKNLFSSEPEVATRLASELFKLLANDRSR